MPVPTALTDFSTTAGSNSPAGTDTIGTSLDDYLRGIQAVTRAGLAHKGADIASATTTDIGAVVGLMHDITGTTTITGLGTVAAGIWKILKFEGALTLTHNATSLILLTGANRTTVAGDVGIYISEGAGNWRELVYMPVNVQLTGQGVAFPATQAASANANTLDDYEEGTFTPALTFGGGSTGITYSTQSGRYTKIGNRVFYHLRITLTAKGSSTGSMLVTSLPFTQTNTVSVAAAIYGNNMSQPVSAVVTANGTTMQVFRHSGSSAVAFADTDMADTSDLMISGQMDV